MRHVIVVGLILLMSGGSVWARDTASEREQVAVTINENEDADRVELAVKGMYLYLTTSRTIVVRLYSILGQLITQQTLQPGTTRLKAPVKGVYILQAGQITRRVTVN